MVCWCRLPRFFSTGFSLGAIKEKAESIQSVLLSLLLIVIFLNIIFSFAQAEKYLVCSVTLHHIQKNEESKLNCCVFIQLLTRRTKWAR